MLPPFLKPGDRVHLLSVSRTVDFDMAPARAILHGWGLDISEGPTTTARDAQFAGSAATRAADLQAAINDDTVRAILFCRGGYGAAQIIDDIDFTRLRTRPKWLVGYSDITLLHAHVGTRIGLPSLHGPMLMNYASASAEDIDALRRCLFGPLPALRINHVSDLNAGTATGPITGGNLSMLHTLAATPSDISYDGKILFIEDVHENLMSIERMLITLKRAGKLAGLAGLIVGDFTIPVKDNETSNNMFADLPVTDAASATLALRRIVTGIVGGYGYPVCFGFPAGHEKGRNRSLVFNHPATLHLTADTLTLEYAV